MMFSLAPVTAQGWATGIAASILTIAFGFLIVSRVRDRKGIVMTYIVASAMVWAWFGFFYGLTPDLSLARDFRVIGGIAVPLMAVSMIYFASIYLEEVRPLKFWERYLRDGFLIVSVFLSVWFIGELFGQQNFIGSLHSLSSETLSPPAGPFLWLIVAQNLLAVIWMSYPFLMRILLDPDKKSPGRRQALIFLFTFSLGTLSACTRWGPWYGVETPPALGIFSVPLIIGGMFYLIKNYELFNVQVLSTQLLIFATWVFVFFRIILNPFSLESTLPDVFLLAGLVVLGILLMRSVVRELYEREEVETVRREQAIDRAKTEFISIAAHQLRTPLSGIKWVFSILLTDAARFTPEQRDIIEKGGKRADALIDIVNDLLDVQTMSTGKFRYALTSGDIGTVVQEAADALEESARSKGLQLIVEKSAEPVVAQIDMHKVGLALQNVVDNAIKYTRAGSVRIAYAYAQGGIAISVADTGIGLPKEDKERIFQKFFRGSEASHLFVDGSGLGLYIVKRIIEDHGGRVTVESTLGKGTTFTLWLPQNAQIAAA